MTQVQLAFVTSFKYFCILHIIVVFQKNMNNNLKINLVLKNMPLRICEKRSRLRDFPYEFAEPMSVVSCC